MEREIENVVGDGVHLVSGYPRRSPGIGDDMKDGERPVEVGRDTFGAGPVVAVNMTPRVVGELTIQFLRMMEALSKKSLPCEGVSRMG